MFFRLFLPCCLVFSGGFCIGVHAADGVQNDVYPGSHLVAGPEAASPNNDSENEQPDFAQPDPHQPDRGRGKSTLLIQAPIIAGEVVAVQLVYENTVELLPGSALQLGRHWSELVRFQNASKSANNYVDITSSAQNARFKTSYREIDGLDGGLESLADSVVFTLIDGVIPAGSRTTLLISQLNLPTHVQAQYRLPLYLRSADAVRFVKIPGTSVAVSPGPLKNLSLSGQSLVRPGQPVDLWIRLEDQHGNLIKDRTISLDLLVNGTFRQRVNVTGALQRIDGVVFNVPGHYQLEVRSGGGGLRAQSNVISVDNYQHNILWADMAATSQASDGANIADEVFNSRAGDYDLVILADHDQYLMGNPGTSVDEVTVYNLSRELNQGGALLRLVRSDGELIEVAVPEQPTDLRYQTPQSLRLVQIVAGGSVYAWLGDRAAAAGYQVGFVGSNHSHQYPEAHKKVYTAIEVRHGQSWFDALMARQTYVSVGSKIILLTDNSNLGMTSIREPGLRVIADQPIRSIKLFKNGSHIASRQGQLVGDNEFTLTVNSSSEPFSGILSKPRNARQWVGYIATRDAIILIDDSHLGNWQVRQGPDRRRFDFLTRTHGRQESFDFSLDDPGHDTVLEIGIAEGFEDAAWLPEDRLPQETTAQRFLVPLNEVQSGAFREIEVNGYKDTLTIHPATNPLAAAVTFTHIDTSMPRYDDYYYFLVELIDGSYAYSSPIHVGDF